MCDFISWVEKRGKVKFLTGTIIQSEKFQEVAKTWGISPDDYNGHGSIRAYYGIDEGDGINKEQTDFSSPDNFPQVIVMAIKDGEMRGLGISKGLLSVPAWAQYEAVIQPARAQYQAVIQPAGAQYMAMAQTARAQCDVGAQYEAVIQPAWAQYDAVAQPARAQYQAVEQTAFWDLFADPANREEVWR